MSERNVVTIVRPVRRGPEGPTRFRVFSLRYLTWLLWPVLAGVIYLMLGLPHLRFSYTYFETGAGPYYTRCMYWAPWGRHERRPTDGACPLIGFHHP